MRKIFYKDDKNIIYWDEIGNSFQVCGVLIRGKGLQVGLLLPYEHNVNESFDLSLTMEEWQEFLKYSDNPQLVITDEERKVVKAIVQKNTRQIEEIIRWRVYKRDHFQCQYCSNTDRPLTVDHYLCQELGGATVMENLKTSCRPCNKAKGNKSIHEWEEYRKKKGLKGLRD